MQVSLKFDKHNGYFTWRPIHIFDHILLNSSYNENGSQINVTQKIKTHISYSIMFLRKSCRLRDSVEKYCKAGQATDDNMTHAHCMLDTKGCKRTLRICNTYCFPTAKVVTPTRLNVTLSGHCLSCVKISSVCRDGDLCKIRISSFYSLQMEFNSRLRQRACIVSVSFAGIYLLQFNVKLRMYYLPFKCQCFYWAACTCVKWR